MIWDVEAVNAGRGWMTPLTGWVTHRRRRYDCQITQHIDILFTESAMLVRLCYLKNSYLNTAISTSEVYIVHIQATSECLQTKILALYKLHTVVYIFPSTSTNQNWYTILHLLQTRETVTPYNWVVKTWTMITDSYKCLIFLSLFDSIM